MPISLVAALQRFLQARLPLAAIGSRNKPRSFAAKTVAFLNSTGDRHETQAVVMQLWGEKVSRRHLRIA